MSDTQAGSVVECTASGSDNEGATTDSGDGCPRAVGLPSGLFDRGTLLSWRFAAYDANPVALGLRSFWDYKSVESRGRHDQGMYGQPIDRQFFGSLMRPTTRSGPASRRSAGGWSSRAPAPDAAGGHAGGDQWGAKAKGPALKPTTMRCASSRAEELERSVLVLLNKICPENLPTIVKKLGSLEIHNGQELECLVRTLLTKALNEPHYCETYADAVYELCPRYPEFPASEDGAPPQSFRRVLINIVQAEFESIPDRLAGAGGDSADETQHELTRRKALLLANMKFIGHLYLRKLLSLKVIGYAVRDLVGGHSSGTADVEDHVVECACTLLGAIGQTLDAAPDGQFLMSQFVARLVALKRRCPDGGPSVLSRRVQFQVQDLIDLRDRGWVLKLFREQAKTLAGVRSAGTGAFELQAAGARPAYVVDAPAPGRSGGGGGGGGGRGGAGKAEVQRLLEYFAEDRDVDALCRDWQQLPARMGAAAAAARRDEVLWLLEAGSEGGRKAEAAGEAALMLLEHRLVRPEDLDGALSCFFERLPDALLDAPHAAGAVHCLLAALFLLPTPTPEWRRGAGAGGGGDGRRDGGASGGGVGGLALEDLPTALLASVASMEPADARRVLEGTLREAQRKAGRNGVSACLGRRGLRVALCRARGCKPWELEAALRADGLCE